MLEIVDRISSIMEKRDKICKKNIRYLNHQINQFQSIRVLKTQIRHTIICHFFTSFHQTDQQHSHV